MNGSRKGDVEVKNLQVGTASLEKRIYGIYYIYVILVGYWATTMDPIYTMIKWNPYVQHHIDRCTRSPIDYVAIIMISADQSKSEQAFILLACLVCVRHHWQHDLCDFESFEGGSVSGDLVPNGGRVSTFIAQCRWRMVANASRRQQWLIAWMFREECEET